MKVATKRLKDNKVSLDVEVSKEAVKKKFDEIYDKIGKEIKIPGFRPGKAPRHILEQHHSKLASEEVIKDLVSESYQESIKSENIDVIDLPQITDVKLNNDTLSYKAEVEVKPEIKITQYKGLKLKKNEIKHLIGKKQEQGLTLVPIKIYTKRSFVKLEFGVGRGKKKYDKREAIKKKELDRTARTLTKEKLR